MKIKIDDITEAGLSVDLSEEGKDLEALAKDLDYRILPPVKAHLDISRTHANIFIAGDMTTTLAFDCSRCLKPFEQELRLELSAFFVIGKEDAREKELKEADMEVNYITGDELDTNELLMGHIALEAPVKPLCREDCLGLCPRCGADLNQGVCGCKVEAKTDNRFAKLKDFKVK